MSHPLRDLRLPGPTLVLVDGTDAVALEAIRALDQVPGIDGEVVDVATLDGSRRGWGSVLAVAADRARLRQLVGGLAMLGQCRAIACWLPEATAPWVLAPRPDWPPATHLVARTLDRGVLTVARFATGARAHVVVTEMARQALGQGAGLQGGDGVLTAYAERRPAPGFDPAALVLAEASEAGDDDRDVPPDVVVAPGGQVRLEPHHVTGRAPTLVTDPGPEPVDERVFNPIGFTRGWTRPVVALRELTPGPVTEAVVGAARDHQGVRLDATMPEADLLRLAMSGVPLVDASPGPGIATPLAAALAAGVDLDDRLAREEHSLAVRRAAFDHHSTLAWRSGLAARSGARLVGLPPVSALLATRRPEMLEFALRQVARQRGADVELVLAAHGFDPDPALVARMLGDVPHVVLSREEGELFGDVLAAAADAASADVVVKLDDDDWYSPDALHDLLMARRYSGADVVGMPHEFVHLAELDVTVRRNHPTELFTRFVAGGTLMVGRGTLRELGSFRPVRRFVDAQLLSAARAAGARVYRTHGLGYVLRRAPEGHTWAFDVEEFRRPDLLDTEWPGFRPSRAMEVDALDRP